MRLSWRRNPVPSPLSLSLLPSHFARTSAPTSFSAYTRPYSRHRTGEGRTPRRETWERWHTDSLPHIPFCLFNVFVFVFTRSSRGSGGPIREEENVTASAEPLSLSLSLSFSLSFVFSKRSPTRSITKFFHQRDRNFFTREKEKIDRNFSMREKEKIDHEIFLRKRSKESTEIFS